MTILWKVRLFFVILSLVMDVSLTKRRNVILIILVVACIAMSIVDGVIQPGYWIKSMSKWVFFVVIPLLFLKDTIQIKELFHLSLNELKQSLFLGLGVYALIMVAYLVASLWFDFSTIGPLLDEQVNVNATNFLFVSTYIALVNSGIEVFFFRGVGYQGLKQTMNPKVAGWISSVLFSLYHVAIMIGWFHISIFTLILISLIVAGWLFIYLNRKSSTFFHSWFVHMFANLAINTIGWIILL